MQPVRQKGSNFRRFCGYAFLASLVAGVAFIFFIKNISRDDANDYQALMKLAGEDKEKKMPSAAYTLNQKRQHVRKDMFFMENGDRKKLRLTSGKTELVVDNHDGKTTMTEKLVDVCCWMQEELYYKLPDTREATRQANGRLLLRKGKPENPNDWVDESLVQAQVWQRLRYMEADEAYYSHGSERIVAQHVKLSRYQMPGDALPDNFKDAKPLLSGIAESVSFSLGGQELNFKASKFKAVVNSLEQ